MSKYLAAVAAAIGLVASGFATATAGVVISETETFQGGPVGKMTQTRERTMMIDGNKEKMILDDGRLIITDLDKAKIVMVNPKRKMYIESPFPPPGLMAQGIGGPGMHASQFTKAGTTRTVLGYKCDDYNGKGKIAMGDFTLIYCVSNTAPGAADFNTFQKAAMAKFKGNHSEMLASAPDGIPLVQDTVTTFNVENMPNMPAEAVEKLKSQFANRGPIMSKTEVTKIAAQKIAATEFDIPAGYTKREPMMMAPNMGAMRSHPMNGGGASAPAAAASPAPKKP
jgi:hypothetical protein